MTALIQCRIKTSLQRADATSDFLLELGAFSISLQAANEEEVFQFEPDEQPLWQQTEVVAIFPIEEQPLVQSAVTNFVNSNESFTIEAVPEKDWVKETQRQFQPMCFSDESSLQKLWICPSWHEAKDLEGKVVMLDPGVAFGTGTHATTSLCLNWLSQQDLHNQVVIDYGCGSGILALAAAKLGAAKVFAVDHDPQAVAATQQNAEQNQLSDTIIAALPGEIKLPKAPIVLANILAKPLISLQPTLTERLATDGKLLLSGILAEEADSLIACYSEDLSFVAKRQRDEWVALEFNNPAATTEMVS